MSFYLSLIMAVLVLGMLSRSWKQRWLGWQENKVTDSQAAQNETPDTIARVAASVETLTTPVRTRVVEEVTSLRKRLAVGAKQAELADRFRAWAVLALTEDEKVVRWLTGLSPAANVAFTQQLAEFCGEMGFDLTALLAGELQQLPTAAEKAREIVRLYCRTNHQAAFAQNEFDASKRLLAYLRAPTQRSNQIFGESLYDKLVAQGLAPAPPFNITQATVDALHTHRLATIRQVAAQQPDAFTTVLGKMMAETE